jgi:hypothetical protein
MLCRREDGRCRRSPDTEAGPETVWTYLSGQRQPGRRQHAGPDRFEQYCRLRFGADPHLWATTLFEEVAALGYEGSYPSFTRALRERGLRPRCEDCAAAGTPAEFAVIDHPAGEETQWDWVELPGPPASWGWGRHAHLLVGALSHSGGWRGTLAESEEQPYLVASLHGVCERLGGVTRRWRFDRMAAVCHSGTGYLTASFAEAAKHYGVVVDVCRHGGAGARAWWNRRTTPRRSGGGGRCPMTSPRRRPRPGWMRGAPGSATPAAGSAAGSGRRPALTSLGS